MAFAGVGQIVRLCLISGESASARTHCLLGPHASCPASQAIRVRTEQVPDMLDQTRSGEPAPRSREALPPEWERRCGGNPTVQEGGGDPSIKKKTPTVLGIQQVPRPAAGAAPEVPAAAAGFSPPRKFGHPRCRARHPRCRARLPGRHLRCRARVPRRGEMRWRFTSRAYLERISVAISSSAHQGWSSSRLGWRKARGVGRAAAQVWGAAAAPEVPRRGTRGAAAAPEVPAPGAAAAPELPPPGTRGAAAAPEVPPRHLGCRRGTSGAAPRHPGRAAAAPGAGT